LLCAGVLVFSEAIPQEKKEMTGIDQQPAEDAQGARFLGFTLDTRFPPTQYSGNCIVRSSLSFYTS